MYIHTLWWAAVCLSRYFSFFFLIFWHKNIYLLFVQPSKGSWQVAFNQICSIVQKMKELLADVPLAHWFLLLLLFFVISILTRLWVLMGSRSCRQWPSFLKESIAWKSKSRWVEPPSHQQQTTDFLTCIVNLNCVWLCSFAFSLTPQTLCILANIADGSTAKELLMSNDDMLQKLKYYMVRLKPSTVNYLC